MQNCIHRFPFSRQSQLLSGPVPDATRDSGDSLHPAGLSRRHLGKSDSLPVWLPFSVIHAVHPTFRLFLRASSLLLGCPPESAALEGQPVSQLICSV
ncbi:Hypothetical protein NTJ_09585 [Nesidiocoris tenuis]|uniref:Uncharacterized protein n=1 Tax=Nesidiocoris tenuis TaxID=355587 RepID=A0ABN7B202_9HEMI|nr:Hypothetical protein NTJ_09585 [Nesidiocoris tenuis]